MRDTGRILNLVQESAKKKILFLPHAVRQMSRIDRLISTTEIRRVVEIGEIIEDYPKDSRGHSCLILGKGEEERAIHVVCSPKDGFLVIITAYLPSNQEWENEFRKRRK